MAVPAFTVTVGLLFFTCGWVSYQLRVGIYCNYPALD